MSNNIVRYNNGLNGVALRTFTPVDMNLFWAVCSKMKRKKTNKEIFTFEEIRDISSYDQRGQRLFAQDVKRMADKLGGLVFYYEDEHIWERLNLFQRFIIDKENETLTVQVNEQFEYILNSIGTNFTRFELENMTRLNGSYAKELYRQLMQHRDKNTKKGAWFVKADEFRALLAIPKSYRMSDIDKQIFTPAKKEFTKRSEGSSPIFSMFRVEKVKAKKGNRIASFRIYFEESKKIQKPEIPMHDWTK